MQEYRWDWMLFKNRIDVDLINQQWGGTHAVILFLVGRQKVKEKN